MKAEVKVGLLVISALVLLYLFVAWAGRRGQFATDTQEVVARFEQVDGLLEGDPVEWRGYVVGEVLRINPTAEAVEVVLNLRQEVPLKTDAYAEIQVKELMGGKQVALYPGASEELLAENSFLRGSSSPDFSSAFSSFGEITSRLDDPRIDRLLSRMDTLTGLMVTLTKGISPQSIDQTVLLLESSTRQLNTLLTQSNRRGLLPRVDTTLQNLQTLSADAQESLETLNRMGTRIETQSLPKVEELLTRFDPTLSRADSLLHEVHTTLQLVRNNNSLAGRLLYDPALSTSLDTTLVNLNKTLTYIRTQKIHVAMSLSHKKRVYK